MSEIARRIAFYRQALPPEVRLLCVSKYHPIEAIEEAYQAGERCFGESRVKELLLKHEALPKDIEWHFIGHLQTNKIRPLLPFVSLVEGVDSWHLLEALNEEASLINRPIKCLLEVKIAQESTKYGFTLNELETFLQQGEWQKLDFVQIVGLMGMATQTDNKAQIRKEFEGLHEVFERFRTTYFLPAGRTDFTVLSMGMTEDYDQAVLSGSTMVRIGSGIFGEKEEQ